MSESRPCPSFRIPIELTADLIRSTAGSADQTIGRNSISPANCHNVCVESVDPLVLSFGIFHQIQSVSPGNRIFPYHTY